jgi:hypothetical protein
MAKTQSLHDGAKKWLQKNQSVLEQYPGKYILVTSNGVEMTDDDQDTLMQRAIKAGYTYPLILWAGVGFQEA